jgi:ubiquinone/menaquinone biosynthesis C-methylase UbiE
MPNDPSTRAGDPAVRSHSIRTMLAWPAVTACLFVLAATWGAGQTAAPARARQSKSDPKINEPFHKPDLKGFIAKFESNDREVYARRHEIVAAVGLKPGMSVADVGAGTGLFTRLFAEKVGPAGRVYAVDISLGFLKYIASEARKRGLKQVVTVLGSQLATNLPKESVDVVFMSDTYHHLENPDDLLASISQALRPRGKFVVVEFDRVEGKSTTFVLKHVRASQREFRREIEAAGFRAIALANPPRLRENFLLTFEKSPSRASRESLR